MSSCLAMTARMDGVFEDPRRRRTSAPPTHFFRRRPRLLVRPLKVFNHPVRKAPDPRSHFIDHIVIVRHQQHRDSFGDRQRSLESLSDFVACPRNFVRNFVPETVHSTK